MREHKFRVRASSIAEFFDCPQRWAAKYLMGERTPASAAALIGTAVHRSTAEYDASRLEDPARWLSVDDTADVIVETLKDPGEDVEWGGMPLAKAVSIGVGCHVRYCSDVAPTQFYSDVELPLSHQDIEIWQDSGDLVVITLTGTLDRIREDAIEYYADDGTPQIDVKYGISDVKTGARAISQSASRHKAQLAVYEVLAEHSKELKITLPGQIIALQTSSNFAAELKEVERPRDALVGTKEQKGLLQHMAQMLVSGDFYGNASSFLCSERYCPAHSWCLFR